MVGLGDLPCVRERGQRDCLCTDLEWSEVLDRLWPDLRTWLLDSSQWRASGCDPAETQPFP